MITPVAVLSMLHEPADVNSATRLFHGQPVLAWTLRRLSHCRRLAGAAVLCWDDQRAAIERAAGDCAMLVMPKGPRQQVPMVEAVAASRRWSDGWRGGLLGATCFDAGFHAAWTEAARQQAGVDSVLLIEPSGGLADPALIDGLIDHADAHPNVEYCFTPAAPGLSGLLIRAALLQRLGNTHSFPGRLLNYHPETPGRDPIAKEECAPLAPALARTTHRFTLDSRRQVQRLESATAGLNGQLIATSGEALLGMVAATAAEPFPRDVVLELNTERRSRAVHSPATSLDLSRNKMDFNRVRVLFEELGQWDDVRLTLAGVGDPMLHPRVFEIMEAAHAAGIRALHVETDLIDVCGEDLRRLAGSPADVVSVHVPGVSASTYQQVMGIDALDRVIDGLRLFFDELQKLGRATPLLAPTFVKLRANVHEMEAWYDHWLSAVGCAVIAAPTDYAGQIADHATMDMSPPARRACRRLASRMTVLSDGRIVACENEVLGLNPLGMIARDTIEQVWRSRMAELRDLHAAGRWACASLCGGCRDWHRP